MDPRRQGQGFFTDLLRQNGVGLSCNLDDSFIETLDEMASEVEVSDTPPVTPQSRKKPPRGAAFTIEEDKLIISAWLNISQDPIIGNGQKTLSYWKRVSEYFHSNKTSEGIRTPNALMNRWSAIRLAVNKFCGYYTQVEQRNRSGTNEDDKISEAKAMYKEFVRTRFSYDHCWVILRYEQKWVSRTMITEGCIKDKGKGKKSTPSSSTPESVSLGEDNASTPISYAQTEKPIGRKAAKAREARRRSDDKQQSEIQATLDRMDENALRMHKEKLELLKESLAADALKEQRKAEKAQREIEKAQREIQRDEHMILTMDTTNLDTPTKKYYKRRKTEILDRAGVL